jgi:ABC-type glutathione transport system ATPase component
MLPTRVPQVAPKLEGKEPYHGCKQRPLIRIEDLTKTYLQGSWWEKQFRLKALDGATLVLEEGTTVALVGRSGSGKTTLAMCVALLELPDSGKIWFNGHDIHSLPEAERRLLRPRIQICFQDSTALPARYTARQIIEEPLRIQRRYSPAERVELISELMETVGLPATWGNRVAEPLVGLDMIVQAQIVDLLLRLQATHSLTYLFISHDPAMVRHLADSVALMEQGKIIEQCSVSDFCPHSRQA